MRKEPRDSLCLNSVIGLIGLFLGLNVSANTLVQCHQSNATQNSIQFSFEEKTSPILVVVDGYQYLLPRQESYFSFSEENPGLFFGPAGIKSADQAILVMNIPTSDDQTESVTWKSPELGNVLFDVCVLE